MKGIQWLLQLYNMFDFTGHQSHPAHEFRPDIPSHGVGNDGDLSDREIDRISRQIGLEWERLGTFLDYETKGQINALKRIYRDQVQALEIISYLELLFHKNPKNLL